MQFINYFFASVVSFSGLVVGMLLAKIAPEEQKPLEKYFDFARKTLLLAIFIFLAFYFFSNYASLLVLLGYFAFVMLIEFKLKDVFKKTIVTYTVLGILFFLSSKNMNLFVIESSLVMLYGIPTASLLCKRKDKNHYKVLLYNIGFVIIANLLFFL